MVLNGDTKKTMAEWSELGVTYPNGTPLVQSEQIVGIVADTKEIAKRDLYQPQTINEFGEESDIDIAPTPAIQAYLTYPNFYRIKRWNNSSWYAIAIGELSGKLK